MEESTKNRSRRKAYQTPKYFRILPKLSNQKKNEKPKPSRKPNEKLKKYLTPLRKKYGVRSQPNL